MEETTVDTVTESDEASQLDVKKQLKEDAICVMKKMKPIDKIITSQLNVENIVCIYFTIERKSGYTYYDIGKISSTYLKNFLKENNFTFNKSDFNCYRLNHTKGNHKIELGYIIIPKGAITYWDDYFDTYVVRGG